MSIEKIATEFDLDLNILNELSSFVIHRMEVAKSKGVVIDQEFVSDAINGWFEYTLAYQQKLSENNFKNETFETLKSNVLKILGD